MINKQIVKTIMMHILADFLRAFNNLGKWLGYDIK